jgi:hypothetical protein
MLAAKDSKYFNNKRQRHAAELSTPSTSIPPEAADAAAEVALPLSKR